MKLPYNIMQYVCTANTTFSSLIYIYAWCRPEGFPL